MSVPYEPSFFSICCRFIVELSIVSWKNVNDNKLTIFVVLVTCFLFAYLYKKAVAFQMNNPYCLELKDVVLRLYNAADICVGFATWVFETGIGKACKFVFRFLAGVWRSIVLAFAVPYLVAMCIVSCFTTKYAVREGTPACFSSKFKEECDSLGLTPVSPPATPRGPATQGQGHQNRMPNLFLNQRVGAANAASAPARAPAVTPARAPVPTAPEAPHTPTVPEVLTLWIHESTVLDSIQYDVMKNHFAALEAVYATTAANARPIAYTYNGCMIPRTLFDEVRAKNLDHFIQKRQRVG